MSNVIIYYNAAKMHKKPRINLQGFGFVTIYMTIFNEYLNAYYVGFQIIIYIVIQCNVAFIK